MGLVYQKHYQNVATRDLSWVRWSPSLLKPGSSQIRSSDTNLSNICVSHPLFSSNALSDKIACVLFLRRHTSRNLIRAFIILIRLPPNIPFINVHRFCTNDLEHTKRFLGVESPFYCHVNSCAPGGHQLKLRQFYML